MRMSSNWVVPHSYYERVKTLVERLAGKPEYEAFCSLESCGVCAVTENAVSSLMHRHFVPVVPSPNEDDIVRALRIQHEHLVALGYPKTASEIESRTKEHAANRISSVVSEVTEGLKNNR